MKRIFQLLARKLVTSDADGARWFKLRHALADPARLFGALRARRAISRRAALNDRIVVIGTGFASLAFIRQLSAAGYRDITVVTRDDLYGGKCVNVGCMPTEFVLSRAHEPVAERREDLAALVTVLRQDVADQFPALGCPIVRGQATHIAGSSVHLEDGREIPFDRLAVAMGSQYQTLTAPSGSAVRVISIEDFWTLPPETRIVIDGRENVAALSLATAARSLGLHPTVLLNGRGGVGGLPSFRYLLRRVAAGGSKVHSAARLIRVGQDHVTIADRGKMLDIGCDCLLPAGTPIPILPRIDGQDIAVYDLDFAQATYRARPDISFLGDSAGYFTASEAEAQAKLVARLWETGKPIDLGTLRKLPLALDGPEPLCMVGPPATLFRSDWIEIDFRTLGWSKVHALEGKLWYLLDREAGMIEAIHICHANAKDLIAIARLLLDHRVTDDQWLATALHPTAAEIFHALADDAKRKLVRRAPLDPGAASPRPTVSIYRLPDVADLSPGADLPDWLSGEDAVTALISDDPRRILASRFATANLAHAIAGEGDPAAFVVSFEAGRCEARHGDAVVRVEY